MNKEKLDKLQEAFEKVAQYYVQYFDFNKFVSENTESAEDPTTCIENLRLAILAINSK